jgi:hypothetical protein
VTTPGRQERNQQGGEGAPLDRSQSDDSKQSVAFIEQLQVAAQQRIDKTRNPNDIGVAP